MGVRKCESESVQEGGGDENWSDNGEMSSVLFVLYNLNADKYPPSRPSPFFRLWCWTNCHFHCIGTRADSSACVTLFSALHPDSHSDLCIGTSGVEKVVVGPQARRGQSA